MRTVLFLILVLVSAWAQAEVPCDVRVGRTIGLQVVEFATDNVVHSKMSLREGTPEAIEEEIINLQEEGICQEKLTARKCVLRLEKKNKTLVTLYRGKDRWLSWEVKSKKHAQNYVIKLKKIGLCS